MVRVLFVSEVKWNRVVLLRDNKIKMLTVSPNILEWTLIYQSGKHWTLILIKLFWLTSFSLLSCTFYVHEPQLQNDASRIIEHHRLSSLCVCLPLKLFFSFRKSKYDILMENVSNILQLSPDQMITMMALREQLVSVSVSVCRVSVCSSRRLWE